MSSDRRGRLSAASRLAPAWAGGAAAVWLGVWLAGGGGTESADAPVLQGPSPLQRTAFPFDVLNPCGVIAVATASRLVGVEVSLEQAGDVLPVDAIGTATVGQVDEAFRALGVAACPLRLRNVAGLTLPAVMHFGGRHFAAVLPLADGRFAVVDPASRPAVLDADELLHQTDGVAVVVAGNTDRLRAQCRRLGVAVADGSLPAPPVR